jgi:hypothetical protein
MNSHTEYRRHSVPTPVEATARPDSWPVNSELARHGDPSLTPGPPGSPGPSSIGWVRPTQLAAYTAPLVGRGIDLQAELSRRTRRAPVIATRAILRSAQHPLPQARPPTRPIPSREGPTL